ncbi:MAG: NADH-quinone oxidoreductase subunit C [Ignavibacteria bacterium]|jgi:NADH-quinone oxidoreductase subunit C
MKKPEEIFELLKSKFGEAVIQLDTETPAEAVIAVSPMEIDKICLFLRDENQLEFNSLMNLSGVDDSNGEKVTDENGNETMKGGTLSVFYHLDSVKLKHKITLKVSTDRDNPEIASVEEVWRSADWHEREAYDMYGIKFLNHHNLIRILMPYDWEYGYPLRKDYENPEFYKGMKVPY